jgi:hypothetical protein
MFRLQGIAECRGIRTAVCGGQAGLQSGKGISKVGRLCGQCAEPSGKVFTAQFSAALRIQPPEQGIGQLQRIQYGLPERGILSGVRTHAATS